MNVAIIGFGIEGQAALEYWSKLQAKITICDQAIDKKSEIPIGTDCQLGPNYLKDLNNFDLIVRSAGVNPKLILDENPNVEPKITTSVNEFLKASPTKKVIGITGTKGKGTTATLVASMLKVAGKEVHLGGNIGLSPLVFLPELNEDSWIVLELSSFQLCDLKLSPAIALCLMVVPEHLNWHDDMEDYIKAKSRLFDYQSSNDLAIYFSQNDISKRIAYHSQGQKIPYYTDPGAYIDNASNITINGQIICSTNELQLLGRHNWQNVCAAVTTVWQITQDIKAIKNVLTSFSGLPYRLEFLRVVNQVKYYNDSFAATPDAAIAALETIPESKVMIMGGFDRQLPLGRLATAIQAHQHDIRKVILIGASAERLASECQKVGFDNYIIDVSKDMLQIVTKAQSVAQPNDAVVLSPGFASFDMFKNFEDRGDQFKRAVENLNNEV